MQPGGPGCSDGSGGAVGTSNFGDDEVPIAGGLAGGVAARLTSRLIGQGQPGHRHVRESLRESPVMFENLGIGRLREGLGETKPAGKN